MTDKELDEALSSGCMPKDLAWEAARTLSQLMHGTHSDLVVVPRQYLMECKQSFVQSRIPGFSVKNWMLNAELCVDAMIAAAQKGKETRVSDIEVRSK